MIGIIDYGMGNLKSIFKAIRYLGYQVKLVKEPADLKSVSGMILPGVGAFPKAMENLKKLGYPTMIKTMIKQGKPILGICLGMQLLFARGYEGMAVSGLEILPGEVRRIKSAENLKIPHMGWNRLQIKKHPLWQGLSSESFMYFVHSYALQQMTADVIGTTFYGQEIPVAVAHNNVLGVQFHPEKSGREGLMILNNFGRML